MHPKNIIGVLKDMYMGRATPNKIVLNQIIATLEWEMTVTERARELVKSSETLITAFQETGMKELNYIQWHKFLEAVENARNRGL